MFEARLEKGVTFKKIVDAIKDLVKNVNLDMNNEGISLQAMDSSHVALVSLYMKEKGFKRYRCDRNITMGLSIENLSKILKCAGNEDILQLKTQEEEATTLQFTFESKKGDRVSEFTLNLMSLDSEQLGIPDTEYTSVVTMPSNEFAKICRELALINESITISTSKEGIKFSVHGEIGGGTINIKAGGETNADRVECDVEEPVSLSFAVRYLNLFTKASGLSESVRLSMHAEAPLVVEFTLAEDLGSLKFYLAPKIGDDEQQQ